MPISDGRVLEFPNSPKTGQHVLHRCFEALVRVPFPHAFVQGSKVLEQQDFNYFLFHFDVTFENFLQSMSMFSTSMLHHGVVFHSSMEVLPTGSKSYKLNDVSHLTRKI